MRVLLASGDHDRLRDLAPSLGAEGFGVISVSDGRDVVARQERPDAYILDASLPTLRGTQLCRSLRQSGCTAQPIVLLTAGPGDPQTEEAYLSGADDCVPRTTSARQLAMRIRAIMRRSQTTGEQAPPTVTVGDLTIDTEAHLARRLGAEVPLSRTELRIAYILALNAGQVIPTARLLEYALGSDKVGKGARGGALLLAAHVARIRRKLGLASRGRSAIVCQPGLGYRMDGMGPHVAAHPRAATHITRPTLCQPLAS
jgi:two-component system response regulator MprA